MRVPLSWLREYVDCDLAPPELAHRLTMAGCEVGAIEHVGADWRRVVIGQVEDLSQHARNPTWRLASVDLGDRRLTLVTAATNLRVGDRVPVVLPGGAVGGKEIAARAFDGVVSEGMLCSGAELGLSDDGAGIYVLEPDAPLGAELRAYLGDVVFELEVTPNRPDLLAVVGVAREVAALTGAAVRVPAPPLPEGPRPAADAVRVVIEAPDLCPRYTAAYVEGVRVGPSPAWLQRRLALSGQRPINNVVDISNYVMLELGQPLHMFDADLLGDTIVVRRARAGERLVTLDGVERVLTPEMLVIADAARPVALAGIMGGEDTEVRATTRRVVVESAHFQPRVTRRTARALRLATEAARRFERGVDPEGTARAAARAVALLRELAGGQSYAGCVDVYPGREPPRVIRTTARAIGGLLGQAFPAEQIARTLTHLGFTVAPEGDEGLVVTVPSFRRDVAGMPDLAEEVARIHGYDALPTTLPAGPLPPPLPDHGRRHAAIVKQVLVGCGYQEVITYSLVGPDYLARLDAAADPAAGHGAGMIPIHNPMSAEHSYLRTTLLGSLLETVAANLRHRDRALLFELAAVYLPPLAPLPTEVRRLALVATGPRTPATWSEKPPALDFFDVKGAVEAVLGALRVPPVRWEPEPHPTLHPGRCAALYAETADGSVKLGVIGQVHPVVAERFELEGRAVYAAELDFEALVRLAGEQPPVVPLPRFPGVAMDLAVVLDARIPEREVAAAIREAGAPLLAELRLFDVYQGPPVPAGQRSLAYALVFRAPDRTLTDAEAAVAWEAIERTLRERFGGVIRGRQ
jgi:phenylalanyl-tRNA synthetase beta chain